MAVVMLLNYQRFPQKASLRRKEVRQRAWARSALKLAKVAGFSRALGILQNPLRLCFRLAFACRFRLPSGEPAGTDGASSQP